MFDKLSFVEERYEELSRRISDPEVIADHEVWQKLCKEHSDITPARRGGGDAPRGWP